MTDRVDSELSRRLLFSMQRIRCVEEAIAERYAEQKMRCPVHLSIGQEGVAAAVCAALRRDDFAVSGHRAHAHYLAKGGSLPAMIAEIYGKATGCARGKGGSMHLVDEAAGFMGSTAIVGGTVPVGVGLGYSIKLRRSDRVSCIFFGEAVAETGVFYESLNFAVLKGLPILFVCENNLYSVYSPLSVRQPAGGDVARKAAAMGAVASRGDGNDAREVFRLSAQAVDALRAGAGPHFIEFQTYRWREHCGPNYDNDIGYRTEAEFLDWKSRDPVARLERALRDEGLIGEGDISAMRRAIADEVAGAFAFAETSPFPDTAAAFADLYAGGPPAARA